MAQILKENIRERIFKAAEKLFYEKGYIGTRMQEVAEGAKIPVGLVYSYYKNKEALFDDIVAPVYDVFNEAIAAEEASYGAMESEHFREIGNEYVLKMLDMRRKVVILVDKSSGTRHEKAKKKLIELLEKHILKGLKQKTLKNYDPLLPHILASYYTESLLEIARHYKNLKWARNMLALLNQCYFSGTDSL